MRMVMMASLCIEFLFLFYDWREGLAKGGERQPHDFTIKVLSCKRVPLPDKLNIPISFVGDWIPPFWAQTEMYAGKCRLEKGMI